MKKVNKKVMLTVKITAVVVMVVVIGLVIRSASNQFIKISYNVAMPTAEKFAKLSKWIPKTAEFYMVADVNRVLENEATENSIMRTLSKNPGVASELAKILIRKQGVVGMIALVGQISEKGNHPLAAVIAQGAFDEDVMIPAIRTILATGHAGLVAEDLGGRKMYVEGDVRDPFGFVILNKTHIAVGERETLISLYGTGFDAAPPLFGGQSSIIFGHVTMGPRLKNIMPPGLSLSGVDFESQDGNLIVARIPSASGPGSQDTKMFFEGVRSLMLLQADKNPALAELLDSVSIEGGDTDVTIKGNLADLFVF